MTVTIQLRVPTPTDGPQVHDLIARCPPLEVNSLYCNVLQCTHFAETAVAADRGGSLVGFVAGYVRPDRPAALFVWQIAVAPECRGEGLAVAMLLELLHRDAARDTTYLEASITRTNKPSWRAFRALARSLGADIVTEPWLSRLQHFSARHDSEQLLRIGPIHRHLDARILKEARR